jgi:hypothetical protein
MLLDKYASPYTLHDADTFLTSYVGSRNPCSYCDVLRIIRRENKVSPWPKRYAMNAYI